MTLPSRPLKSRVCSCLAMLIALSLQLTGNQVAHAGISPENVVVVVNGASLDSRTIANHYTQLRDIPSVNVVVLDDVPDGLKISLAEFKERILLPVLNKVTQRGLAAQTRVIAYSAGFPTSVGIAEHTSKLTEPNQKKYQLPTASLTGVTFFYKFLLADKETYLDWSSNLYARGEFDRHFANPFLQPDRRERFEEAVAEREAGRSSSAAKGFETLFKEFKTLSPLGILAAESHARAGESSAAQRLIEQAIVAGWSSGTYLDESDLLAPLMTSARLRLLRSRLADFPTVAQGPIGFSSSVGWTPCGSPSSSTTQGIPYLLSCMLGVVHPRGSSTEQSIAVLAKASSADSTFPDGAFWFMFTRDDRTNPRFPQIGDALLWLKGEGFDAELIHKRMPDGKTGLCSGLMLGTAEMPLRNTTWSFSKGAIAENLTSLSGKFDTASQTKITELLHAGAAMTCGPVHEPYNVQYKFPTALMYAYYASGTTAIEAFYLSIKSPYQQLIVGDPLASPFAKPPTDSVLAGVADRDPDAASAAEPQKLRFAQQTFPLAEPNSGAQTLDIYVEGRRLQKVRVGKQIEMSLPKGLQGVIEVRTVLTGKGPLSTCKSQSDFLTLGGSNNGTPPPFPISKWNAVKGVVEISCQEASALTLAHHGETVGKIEGGSGVIAISREKLGKGPLRLRPIAIVNGAKIPGEPLVVQD